MKGDFLPIILEMQEAITGMESAKNHSVELKRKSQPLN
jgi:hypothetical protein